MHIGKFLVKRMMSDRELDALHAEMVQGLSDLEIHLPLNWCTITHHLLLHLAETFKDMGAFWAHNNLPTERLHVKLHDLARGYCNMMRSFGRHYDLFDFSAVTARFENKNKWMSPPLASSLASERKVASNEGNVEVKGRETAGVLGHALFEQVKNLWATVPEHKGFDRLKDRYEREKRKSNTTVEFPTFRQWHPRGTQLSDEQKSWTQMSKKVRVSSTYYWIDCIYSCFSL
jgi:hypothetical protein